MMAVLASMSQGEVQVVDGWFSWEKGATALRRVNLSVKPGELVAIIGKTGRIYWYRTVSGEGVTSFNHVVAL